MASFRVTTPQSRAISLCDLGEVAWPLWFFTFKMALWRDLFLVSSQVPPDSMICLKEPSVFREDRLSEQKVEEGSP